MKCPACQTENREGARFCLRCGTRLSSAESADEGAAVEQPAALSEETTPPAPPGVLSEEQTASEAPETQEATAETTPVAATAPHAAPSPEITQDTAVPAAQGAEATQATQPASVEPQPAEPAVTTAAPVPEPPAPERLDSLSPGAVIADRFEIVQLLESNPGSNLYSARDLALCPACREERDRSDNAFCSLCGIALADAGPPVVRQLHEALSAETIHASAEQGLVYNTRFYLPLPEATLIAIPEVGPALPHGATLTVGCASDLGMRELDEDGLGVFLLSGVYESVVDPQLGLLIVADGMGGHEGGEVASKLTVQVIADRLLRNVMLRRFTEEDHPVTEAVRAHLVEAVQAANERVYALAQERGNDMGCTLTMALLMDGRAYVANIGDSRTYLFGSVGLKQITKDNSLITRLIAAGAAKEEEIYTHPQRHVLYRALGSEPTVEVDVYEEELAPGVTLVLCCDGLWESIHSEGIEDVLLTESDPQTACDEMVHRANQAGGEDNISVIVARLAPAMPGAKAIRPAPETQSMEDASQKGVTTGNGKNDSENRANA